METLGLDTQDVTLPQMQQALQLSHNDPQRALEYIFCTTPSSPRTLIASADNDNNTARTISTPAS